MCVIESTLTKLDNLKSPGFRIKDFNMCQTCEVVFISKDGFKELYVFGQAKHWAKIVRSYNWCFNSKC